jgi:hypothetical protein
LSEHAHWDGFAFPEDVLTAEVTLATRESSVNFLKSAGRAPLTGVNWPVNKAISGPFAARAKGSACSTAHAWQQLVLLATPGTQLRINGITVADTNRDGRSSIYPRGDANQALFFKWIEPGCYDIEVLFFEPPTCGSNHIEHMSADTGIMSVLKEVKIAYSNTSSVVCLDAGCQQTREVAKGHETVAFEFRLELDGTTLTQSLTMLNKDGRMDEGLRTVRT